MSIFPFDNRTNDEKGRYLLDTHDSTAGRGELYIEGDVDTDESYRLFLGADDNIKVEQFKETVWNRTKLEVAGESLLLGSNLSLSAISQHLQIKSVIGNDQFLGISIPYTDDGSDLPITPIVGERGPIEVFPDFSKEFTVKNLTLPIVAAPFFGFFYGITMKTGNLAATDSVTVTFRESFLPTGGVIFTHNYPASLFSANSDIFIDFFAGVGFVLGEQFTVNFNSEGSFSYLGDETGIPFITLDFQSSFNEPLVMERIIYDNDLGIILDNDLDPIYETPFFVGVDAA